VIPTQENDDDINEYKIYEAELDDREIEENHNSNQFRESVEIKKSYDHILSELRDVLGKISKPKNFALIKKGQKTSIKREELEALDQENKEREELKKLEESSMYASEQQRENENKTFTYNLMSSGGMSFLDELKNVSKMKNLGNGGVSYVIGDDYEDEDGGNRSSDKD